MPSASRRASGRTLSSSSSRSSRRASPRTFGASGSSALAWPRTSWWIGSGRCPGWSSIRPTAGVSTRRPKTRNTGLRRSSTTHSSRRARSSAPRSSSSSYGGSTWDPGEPCESSYAMGPCPASRRIGHEREHSTELRRTPRRSVKRRCASRKSHLRREKDRAERLRPARVCRLSRLRLWWRGQQSKLGHHARLIEIDVDLRKLAALELRDHGDRQSDGLVRGRDRLAPGHHQGSRVGPLDVAQLGNPIPGPELRLRHEPNVGERLEKRVEGRTDRFDPLDPLGILWTPLKDRVQVEALVPVEVAVVKGLRRRFDYFEILFYAH